MMRTEAYIKESMRIFSLLASPQTTPLQKAELNFRFLSMNKTPFRCVQVKNIPAANLRIASLAKHFQYYGDITNITLDEAQHSAVVQF